MIRDALDRMALGERAVLAGVEVERVSLFGFRLWGGHEVFTRGDAVSLFTGAPTWQEMTAGAVKVFGGPASKPAGRDQTLVAAATNGCDTSASSSPPSTDQTSVVGGAADGEREQERLRAGAPETAARIGALRRQHGRALRVTGGARAKRARWTGTEAWLVVSYPKEA